MKIAIEGCCHGELDQIYATIKKLEQDADIEVNLLLICGDFQAVRNPVDLESMAVPEKYKQMCSFWKYYAGHVKAPILTVFVGGNHEASNFMAELPYGGWVAENIYYMGYANVINFGGVRIGGLSGIYSSQDFYKGHFEFPPFNHATMRSVYHVRNLELFRLSQLRQPLDIMLSHDWPTGVYHHGDVQELLRYKSYFAQEINSNTLGSPENERLLKLLKPKYWFSAHLHVKFACVYKHDDSNKVTKFLSLDKCLPRRKFLQVIETESDSAATLCLDPEWLSILKKTDHLLSIDFYNQAPIKETVVVEKKDLDELREDFQGCFEVPKNFSLTAPACMSSGEFKPKAPVENIYLNEQTTLLCEMLSIRDPVRVLLEKKGKTTLVNESRTQLYNDLLDESD